MKRQLNLQPAGSYIPRGLDLVSLQTRIPEELKGKLDEAAKKLDTSQARFVEAAVRWYIDELKKEGSL